MYDPVVILHKATVSLKYFTCKLKENVAHDRYIIQIPTFLLPF